MALCLAPCLAVAACYSYTGNLHVVPGSRPTATDRSPRTAYTDADLESARDVARRVAERFGMRRNDPGAEIVSEMNRELGRGYRVLVYYSRHDRAAATRAGRARVNLGVDVREDRSELVFWVRDLDHGDETDLTRAIREALERLIRARFDASHLRYEKLRITTFLSG